MFGLPTMQTSSCLPKVHNVNYIVKQQGPSCCTRAAKSHPRTVYLKTPLDALTNKLTAQQCPFSASCHGLCTAVFTSVTSAINDIRSNTLTVVHGHNCGYWPDARSLSTFSTFVTVYTTRDDTDRWVFTTSISTTPALGLHVYKGHTG